MPAFLRSTTTYYWYCDECKVSTPNTWPYAVTAIDALEAHNTECHKATMEGNITDHHPQADKPGEFYGRGLSSYPPRPVKDQPQA